MVFILRRDPSHHDINQVIGIVVPKYSFLLAPEGLRLRNSITLKCAREPILVIYMIYADFHKYLIENFFIFLIKENSR